MTRVAVAVVFFANGAGLASWVPHIPEVQARLALGSGTLGFALLGMAVGALVAIPLAGAMISRVGSRAVTMGAALTFFGVLVLPLLAPTLPSLVVALIAVGAGNGAMDVSMNAQALAVERRAGRPIMSSFHALWSVGGIVGAGVCALALQVGVAPRAHLAAAALGLGGMALLAVTRFLPAAADAPHPGRRLARPDGVLLTLGLMALLALVSEGAMGDWSALYLRDTLGASPSLAALGFAVFSLMMAVGRFAGDRLVARFGSVRVVRASTSVGALGLAGALTLADPRAAILGCGCVGFGIANLVPIIFRAAGQLPGVSPGHGLAAVTTAGYCGFLAGPPLIGLVAEVLTLPGALGLVVLCLVGIALAARHVRPRAA